MTSGFLSAVSSKSSSSKCSSVCFSIFSSSQRFDGKDLIWNIRGEDYTTAEMAGDYQTHWSVTQPAVIKVKKSGGLAQGAHELTFGFCFTSSYMPPIVQAGLDPNQENMIFMPEFVHNVNSLRSGMKQLSCP